MFLALAFIFGALVIGLGLVSNFPVAVTILAGLGVLTTMMLTSNNILIQSNVADHVRGRVLSIYFLTFSLTNMGVLFTENLAEQVGLRVTFCASGALVATSAVLVGVRSKAVRQI